MLTTLLRTIVLVVLVSLFTACSPSVKIKVDKEKKISLDKSKSLKINIDNISCDFKICPEPDSISLNSFDDFIKDVYDRIFKDKPVPMDKALLCDDLKRYFKSTLEQQLEDNGFIVSNENNQSDYILEIGSQLAINNSYVQEFLQKKEDKYYRNIKIPITINYSIINLNTKNKYKENIEYYDSKQYEVEYRHVDKYEHCKDGIEDDRDFAYKTFNKSIDNAAKEIIYEFTTRSFKTKFTLEPGDLKMINEAIDYATKGEWQKATEIWTDSLTKCTHKDSYSVRYNLAISEVFYGNYENAITMLEQINTETKSGKHTEQINIIKDLIRSGFDTINL